MIIRRLLWTLVIVVVICVAVFGFFSIGSHLYTARVLARWEEERVNLTGPLLVFPPTGEDKFDSATTLGFWLNCDPLLASSVIAEGPTTIQREAPFTLPNGRQQIPTEMVQLDLQGVAGLGPLVGPITIRESPNKDSLGQITEIEPGTDFPAESFFDVFVEVDIPGGITLINRDPVPMRRIINEIPPLLIDYLPPPDLLADLYRKDNGAYWGCMTHPKHSTIPPIIKMASIPDPDGGDVVNFEISIKNPDSQHSISVQLTDLVPLSLSGDGFQLQGSPQVLAGPPSGIQIVDQNQPTQQIIWGAPSNPSNPVTLAPLEHALIGFDAHVFLFPPGGIVPNIARVDSPGLGLDPSEPITLTKLVPGRAGNLTEAKKEAQPFVNPGDILTYTIILPNTGVAGTAHATLTDEIPPGTTYVSGSVTGGATYDAALNAIVANNINISPGVTKTIEFAVTVSNTLTDSILITNIAVITDNWGNRFEPVARTVVVSNAKPAKLFFEDAPIFEDGFESGDVSVWSCHVTDRQGGDVADGTKVRVTNSGGTVTTQAVVTATTTGGRITGTITSAISQTIVITIETSDGLSVTQSFKFVDNLRTYLPIILKNS